MLWLTVHRPVTAVLTAAVTARVLMPFCFCVLGSLGPLLSSLLRVKERKSQHPDSRREGRGGRCYFQVSLQSVGVDGREGDSP